ncbi:mitochondrial protein [Roridomyces roridus]|uniref:Mitochondrial protein n=1 Tax=Roridomyces roridus TaxID=1738132 RepID=A0AAD7BWX4_9AGAR|nr:mitochondrial protein [Roridomyces roridus]
MTAISKLVVVGGNGFIGSAVCKSALAHGIQVTSVSSSGRPYQTPKGHTPAWVSKVEWVTGDALQPETFAAHLDGADAVVHSLGILLEDAGYKAAVRAGDALGLFRAVVGGRNPLDRTKETYERMNRDAALRVCEAFVASTSSKSSQRPFVFISAADVFRPWVPARYIETKRDAEKGIDALLASHPARFRGVYLRPGLVYHAHLRPLTTPPAVLFDASAALAARLPGTIRDYVSQQTPPSIASIANALATPPLHVDHVGVAAVRACLEPGISGAVGVREMRELIGWGDASVEASTVTIICGNNGVMARQSRSGQ